MTMPESKIPVTHAEAREILNRFVNAAFNKPGDRPRFEIPANPDRDDDLRMSQYIEQAKESGPRWVPMVEATALVKIGEDYPVRCGKRISAAYLGEECWRWVHQSSRVQSPEDYEVLVNAMQERDSK